MICNKCKSKWETDRRISASLVSCPFCGERLVQGNGDKHKTFDNTKEALIFIAQEHGAEVLLGNKLKAFLPDYAPQMHQNIKSLVFAVYEKGAAAILQSCLAAKQADKETAFKQAVSKLTEAFIAQDAAENIIREFAGALGWKVGTGGQPQQANTQSVLHQTASTQTGQQKTAQTSLNQTEQSVQPQVQIMQGSNITYKSDAATGTAAEIRQGKRRNIKFGGYSWRVLDIQGDKALLLTEDIIEQRPYNVQDEDVTWKNCTLRQYLNDEFFNTFSRQERAKILETRNANPNNQFYGTKGGESTVDKVFLLSINEVVKYFGDSGNLENLRGKRMWIIRDQYNDKRMAKYRNVGAWWWLRSPGYNGISAANVHNDGGLDVLGSLVYNDYGGVRPALWLNLKS
ncbi:MAG: DUF6273 domain-containing protein [Clostridiales Family XIII bacterium]|jgi:hypothetical protein|nr:DUF6273 domain-containing protein [Clostridiales Family XIII bacterium]